MGCNQHLPAGDRRHVVALAGALSVVLCGALPGCSFLIDSKAEQCSSDEDCTQFGGHPYCRNAVCVESMLGPDGCVFNDPNITTDDPKTQSDYLNACTTAAYATYDNCTQLKLGCPGGTVMMPPPGGQMNGTQGATVIPPDPTNLCTDGAPGTAPNYNMVWLYGSSDFGPELRAVQKGLSTASPPYRAVFQNATSCQGVTAIFSTPGQKMKDPMPGVGGWAYYFDAGGNQVNCRIEPSGGTPVGVTIDIGISNLFSQTCNPAFVSGTTVRDYLGPIVPFVLAVKGTSTAPSISVEAARLVFGNGGHPPSGYDMKDAAPWTDYKNYYIRNSNAGSTVLTALLIDVPRTQFRGIDRLSTDNLRDGLLAAMDTPTSGAIGILSIDFYDKNRGNLKALYLQSKGQKAGFLPDSTPTTKDKINVRDGHYPLWGYAHMFTQLDMATSSPSAAAKAFILNLSVQAIDQRLLDDLIDASLTPQCAMKVERSSEIGDFSKRTGVLCGCYFDSKTKNKTDCQTCSSAEDCPGKHPCRYGYCELDEPAQ